MKLLHFFPINELLRRHIECYHVSNHDEEYIEQRVVIYPHYLHTVSLLNNLSTSFSDNHFAFRERKNKKPSLSILGRFTKPVLCQVNGRGKALTIVFKPTGINFFCADSFDVIVPNVLNRFSYWDNKISELEELLYLRDIGEITEKLEKILLLFYRPFQNKVLFETLSLLHDDYARYNVAEIEKTLDVNRKSLLRQFKKHLGVSLTDYRRILRFREVLKMYSTIDENLTKLAYKACFSDQSHFIKEIYKLTGDNPRKFFKEAFSVKDNAFVLKRI